MNFTALPPVLTKTYLLTTLLIASGQTWLSSVASADSPPPPSISLHQQVTQFYQYLSTSAKQFQQSSQQLCKSPSSAKLTTTQNNWRQLMNSWMAAEVVNFGPVQQDNMAWRFQFWPDKKNLIKRKVEGFLAAHPKLKAMTPAQVQQASVLVQGLSAAEYLLFDPQLTPNQSVTKSPLRCQMLVSVTTNLLENSQQLHMSWQSQAITQKQSQENNISQLLNSMSTLIERSHKKLVMPLGKQKANPYFAESWRSQHSFDNIKHNLNGVQQLYQAQLKPLLIEKDPKLAQQVDQQFRATSKQLSLVKQSLFTLLQAQQLDQAKQLANNLKQLKQQFSQQLPDTLGVVISFNANDGD